MLLAVTLPESIRFLLGRPGSARRVAALLGKLGHPASPQDRFVDSEESHADKSGIRKLFTPAHRRDTLALSASVVHDHSREIVSFSVSRVGLHPVGHTGGVIGGSVPVWDIRKRFGDRTNMLVSSLAMGLDLATRLGQGSTLPMLGHGAVIAAKSVRLATFIAISLDTQARAQREAISLGPVNGLSPGEIAATAHLFDLGAPGDSMNRAWEYWCARANVRYHPRGT